jgi:hypothetical protein
MLITPTETDKAYFAGIVDGEGCLSITVRQKKAKAGTRNDGNLYSPSYEAVLVVAQKEADPMLIYIQQRYGGIIVSQKTAKGDVKGYTLRMSGNNLRHCLPDLKKYSVSKQTQILIIEEFFKTFDVKKDYVTGLGEDVLACRAKLHLMIKAQHGSQGRWDKSKWDKQTE